MMVTLIRMMQIRFSTMFKLLFVKAYNYCVEWLAGDDAFIKHSVLTDFEKRNDVTFDYIETILLIFNRIHKAVQDPSILNVTEEEFLDCQALSNHNIPDNIWESAKLSDNGYQMSPKLSLLSKIATYVFVVPHSNANEEKFFFNHSKK